MESLPRLEPGKVYHVFNRGNNYETIFKEKRNYEYFLRLYQKHICPVAETYAYCLLPNHFHLAVKIKEFSSATGNPDTPLTLIAQNFSNMFNAYAKAINKAYGRSGALFKHRFRRNEVNSVDSLVRVICYIHTNPVHHGITEEYTTYANSSYWKIVQAPDTPGFLTPCHNLFGGIEKFIQLHYEYQRTRIEHNEEMEFTHTPYV